MPTHLWKEALSKSYHDYIIRNEDDYLSIWQFIDENPAKWTEDAYNGPAIRP